MGFTLSIFHVLAVSRIIGIHIRQPFLIIIGTQVLLLNKYSNILYAI